MIELALLGCGIGAVGGFASALVTRWRGRRPDTYTIRYLEHTVVKRPTFDGEGIPGYVLKEWSDHVRYPALYPKPDVGLVSGEYVALLDVEARGRRETWLVTATRSTREADGEVAPRALHDRLRGVLEVAEARAIEMKCLTGVP